MYCTKVLEALYTNSKGILLLIILIHAAHVDESAKAIGLLTGVHNIVGQLRDSQHMCARVLECVQRLITEVEHYLCSTTKTQPNCQLKMEVDKLAVAFAPQTLGPPFNCRVVDAIRSGTGRITST